MVRKISVFDNDFRIGKVIILYLRNFLQKSLRSLTLLIILQIVNVSKKKQIYFIIAIETLYSELVAGETKLEACKSSQSSHYEFSSLLSWITF